MKSIQDELPLLQQILTLISNHFGAKCEVVLHDLTKDYNSTIVDIRNGELTNRKIGGCGSNLGLEVLRGSVVDGDRYNYSLKGFLGSLTTSPLCRMKKFLLPMSILC